MILCERCRTRGGAAGQAFTRYICAHCFQTHMHANTAVPKLCSGCSKRYVRCQRCCEELPPIQIDTDIWNCATCNCSWKTKEAASHCNHGDKYVRID